MRTFIIEALLLSLATELSAQDFSVLHPFTQLDFTDPTGTNTDGAQPLTGLMACGSRLYGTARAGGCGGAGTVFCLGTDGAGFTVLHQFTRLDFADPAGTNADGAQPVGELTVSGSVLYGVTAAGGNHGVGTIFAVDTNGSAFAVLHQFPRLDSADGNGTNTDGGQPRAGLALSGNVLYGTTSRGGSQGAGTVFAVGTDGSGFTLLHDFTRLDSSTADVTNLDGAQPQAALVLSGARLYGTTSVGGSQGAGTIFSLGTDGSGFTVLHHFPRLDFADPNGTNSDGAKPQAGLTLSGNRLYGTASVGGSQGAGTVFSLGTDGDGFTVLHDFARLDFTDPAGTNTDGAQPLAGLMACGSRLYGTASAGGGGGAGTVFCLGTDGAGFTVLHCFSRLDFGDLGGTNAEGVQPQAAVVLSGARLYGATSAGGPQGQGALFSLSWPVGFASCARTSSSIRLYWPAEPGRFYWLEYTTNLALGSWQFLSEALAPPGGMMSMADSLGPDPQRLYRIFLEP